VGVQPKGASRVAEGGIVGLEKWYPDVPGSDLKIRTVSFIGAEKRKFNPVNRPVRAEEEGCSGVGVQPKGASRVAEGGIVGLQEREGPQGAAIGRYRTPFPMP